MLAKILFVLSSEFVPENPNSYLEFISEYGDRFQSVISSGQCGGGTLFVEALMSGFMEWHTHIYINVRASALLKIYHYVKKIKLLSVTVVYWNEEMKKNRKLINCCALFSLYCLPVVCLPRSHIQHICTR